MKMSARSVLTNISLALGVTLSLFATAPAQAEAPSLIPAGKATDAALLQAGFTLYCNAVGRFFLNGYDRFYLGKFRGLSVAELCALSKIPDVGGMSRAQGAADYLYELRVLRATGTILAVEGGALIGYEIGRAAAGPLLGDKVLASDKSGVFLLVKRRLDPSTYRYAVVDKKSFLAEMARHSLPTVLPSAHPQVADDTTDKAVTLLATSETEARNQFDAFTSAQPAR